MDHKRIFHPTDLAHGSEVAFNHALRLAVASRAILSVMHVAQDTSDVANALPAVRETLAKWGLIKHENDNAGLNELGLGVRKYIANGGDPVRKCLDHLEGHPADLVVLATHQKGGRWFGRSVAEPLARGAGEPALIFPYGHAGFVDRATGAVRLERILIPVAMQPDPASALKAALHLADLLSIGPLKVILLHVRTGASDPLVQLPKRSGTTFERLLREGDIVEQVVHVAQAMAADLVVMPTKGHDGFLDAFRGSTTERVIRAVRCPVLAVPALP